MKILRMEICIIAYKSFIISVKAGDLHVVGSHLGAGIEKGQCPSATC